MLKIIKEYDVLTKDDTGDVLILIDALEGEQGATPQLFIDDLGKVILQRNGDSDMANLANMPADTLANLKLCKNVLIVETHKDGVKRQYQARISQ